MNIETRNMIEIKKLAEKLWILCSYLQKNVDKNTNDIQTFETRVEELSELSKRLADIFEDQDIDEFIENLKRVSDLLEAYLPVGYDNEGKPYSSAAKRIEWHVRDNDRWIDFGNAMEMNFIDNSFRVNTLKTYNSESLTVPNSIVTNGNEDLDVHDFNLKFSNGYGLKMTNGWFPLFPTEQQHLDVLYVADSYRHDNYVFPIAQQAIKSNTLVTAKYLDEFYEAPESSTYLRQSYNNDSIYWNASTGYLTMNAPSITSTEGGVLNLNVLTFGAESTTDSNVHPRVSGIANVETTSLIPAADKDKYLLTLAAAEAFAGINTLPMFNPTSTVSIQWDTASNNILKFGTLTSEGSTTNPIFVVSGVNAENTYINVNDNGTNSVIINPNGITVGTRKFIGILNSEDTYATVDNMLVTAGYLDKFNEASKKLDKSINSITEISWKNINDGSSILNNKTLLALTDTSAYDNGLMVKNIYGEVINASKLSDLVLRIHGNLAFENEALITKTSEDGKLNHELVGVVNQDEAINLFEENYSFKESGTSDKTVPTFAAMKSIIENYLNVSNSKTDVIYNLQSLVNNTDYFMYRSSGSQASWPLDYMDGETLKITTTTWVGIVEICKYLANNLKLYITNSSGDETNRDNLCAQVISYVTSLDLTGDDVSIATNLNDNAINNLYLIELMLATNGNETITNPTRIGLIGRNRNEKVITIADKYNLLVPYVSSSFQFSTSYTYFLIGLMDVRIQNIEISSIADYLNYVNLVINIGSITIRIKPTISSLNGTTLNVQFNLSSVLTNMPANGIVTISIEKLRGTVLNSVQVIGETTIYIRCL